MGLILFLESCPQGDIDAADAANAADADADADSRQTKVNVSPGGGET